MTFLALSALRALYRPSDPAFRGDLTAGQRSVLTVLVMHAGDDGTCWPSVPTIMRASGFKRAMVLRTLGELEAMGAVSRQPRPPKSTVYTVHHMDRPLHGPSIGQTVTVHHMDGHSPPHGPERPIERPIERPTLSDDESSEEGQVRDRRDFPPLAKLPRNGRGRVYPPEFEGAFAALPARHVPHPKAAAYTAWRARVREVEEVFQLEAAADAYREDQERQGKAGTEFVLQAATFFGPGGRFEPYLGREPGALAPPASEADAFLEREAQRLAHLTAAGGVMLDA